MGIGGTGGVSFMSLEESDEGAPSTIGKAKNQSLAEGMYDFQKLWIPFTLLFFLVHFFNCCFLVLAFSC